MSTRETPMTVWYWKQVGGKLIEEFLVVPGCQNQGRRLLDGIIILGERTRRFPVGTQANLRGKDVIVVQTKNSRLGMSLMGQTLFSLDLVRKFCSPRRVRSVAICAKTDHVLQPILESHKGCKVVVCPPEICRQSTRSSRPTKRYVRVER